MQLSMALTMKNLDTKHEQERENGYISTRLAHDISKISSIDQIQSNGVIHSTIARLSYYLEVLNGC